MRQQSSTCWVIASAKIVKRGSDYVAAGGRQAGLAGWGLTARIRKKTFMRCHPFRSVGSTGADAATGEALRSTPPDGYRFPWIGHVETLCRFFLITASASVASRVRLAHFPGFTAIAGLSGLVDWFGGARHVGKVTLAARASSTLPMRYSSRPLPRPAGR